MDGPAPGSPDALAGDAASPAAVGGALRTLLRRSPLVVSPAATVREVLLRMDEARSDAAVVADRASGLPLGIVTLSHVVRHITLVGGSLDEPVAGVMTGGPVTLSADASAHRATVLMSKRRLEHLVLVEADGRLWSLVSRAELFGLRGGGAERLAQMVAAASALEPLAAAAAAIRERGAELFAGGMGVEALCQWMSALNDLVGMRAIELVEDRFDLPPVAWCWLVFGSEGRLEQTFATDQDNGLIFVPGEAADTEAVRSSFLPFARAVNQALDACGFTLCKGEIMAGNPRWCLSLGEWQEQFEAWMRTPEPQALLHTTIFFDFRPLYGRDELADALRQWLAPRPPEHPRFLRAMVEEALTCQPPLGWIGNFRYDGGRKHPRTIDLKLHGARPFVDAARIWSLAHRLWPTNTGQRLRAAAVVQNRKPKDAAAAVEAFYLVQRFRIQQQLSAGHPQASNRLNPATLNDPV